MTATSTRNIEYLKPYKTKKYSIIIPAAGYGHRLGLDEVKALLKVNNQTLIDRQISIIDKIFPNKEIVVVGGYKAGRLFDALPKDVIKVENERYNETNVVRSIGMGLRACTSDLIIVIYSDLFFNKRLLSLPFRKNSFIISNNAMSSREIGINQTANKLESLFYDLPTKWAQVSFFQGLELQLLKQVCFNKDNERMFGYECINQIINMGGYFTVECPRNSIAFDIDTTHDLSHVRKHYANSL
jgi:choline kinase